MQGPGAAVVGHLTGAEDSVGPPTWVHWGSEGAGGSIGLLVYYYLMSIAVLLKLLSLRNDIHVRYMKC